MIYGENNRQPHTILDDYITLPALESMNRKISTNLGILQIHITLRKKRIIYERRSKTVNTVNYEIRTSYFVTF